MVSRRVRELWGPPTNRQFAKPNKELVKMAILSLHAEVKAAREEEAAGKSKGKTTRRPRRAS